MGWGDSQFQEPIAGSFTAAAQSKDLTSPNSGTSVIQIIGTWSGTIVLEGSNDNITYYTIPIMDTTAYLFANSITANGLYISPTNGYQYLRLRTSAWTSGTASFIVYGSDEPSILFTLSQLRGADDGTLIGNVGDRLKVDAAVTSIPSDYGDYLLDLNAVYSATFLVNAASSSSDNDIILFKNPSGSGKKIIILQITGNSTISNERTLFRIFANATASANGTSVTPQPRNVGNGAPAATANVYSLPTITNQGANLSTVESGENTNSQPITDARLMALQPNNNLLVTAKPKSNNRVQAVTMVWAELDIV